PQLPPVGVVVVGPFLVVEVQRVRGVPVDGGPQFLGAELEGGVRGQGRAHCGSTSRRGRGGGRARRAARPARRPRPGWATARWSARAGRTGCRPASSAS